MPVGTTSSRDRFVNSFGHKRLWQGVLVQSFEDTGFIRLLLRGKKVLEQLAEISGWPLNERSPRYSNQCWQR